MVLVTIPMSPRATTAPKNLSPSFARERVWIAPSAVMNSMAETAVERLPFLLPVAVGGSGAGSDDGDMRERGEVVDGEAAGVDDGGEVAVGDACADGDGVGFVIDVDGVELFEGDLVGGAVGDAVEGVATAEGAELGAGGDEVLDFGGGFGLVEVLGVEGVVAGPVGAGGGGLLDCLFC